MKPRDIDKALQGEILRWVGADDYVRRLLRLAYELHGRFEEAREVFFLLQEAEYLRLRVPATMPKGDRRTLLRRVDLVSLYVARVRLVSKLSTISPALSEFVLRDAISGLRQLQKPREALSGDGSPSGGDLRPSLSELYRAIGQALVDCGSADCADLWGQLDAACSELSDEENARCCADIVAELRP